MTSSIAKAGTLLALNEQRVQQAHEASDERLEAIAENVESTSKTAILYVGRLAEAHDIFLYRCDEGGFGGWAETRLRLARSTAYNPVKVPTGKTISNSIIQWARQACPIVALLLK